MPNPYFKFKQFTVYHDLCAMKVGIDGVLLGVWTPIDEAKHILDIGTGSGLIALILAQRAPGANITAIDIDENAVKQAEINAVNSPWNERIEVIQNSLQQFASSTGKKFDLIVSNPPFFLNSLKAPDPGRSTARHTDSLSHEELIVYSKQLLTADGRLCIILPVNEGKQCCEFAEKQGLYCTGETAVHSKPESPAKRLLLEFSQIKAPMQTSELTIETGIRHEYTPGFTLLAKDFYLKL